MTEPAAPGGRWISAAAWSRRGWRTHRGAGSGSGRPSPWAGPGTIPDLAAASARRVPDRVAVSVDGQPVTHGQLDTEARQAAVWLAARLAPGERMLLAAGSSPGFLRWYLGALRAGLVVVLANPGYTAAELGHLVADSGAWLAVADPGPADRLATLSVPGGRAGRDGLAGGDGLAGAVGLVIVAAGDAPPPEPPGPRPEPPRARPAPGDLALLAYTSGTTGRPKGVPLTHRQLAASIQGAMAAWRWTAADVLVHALPLFHQHGLGGVHATLIAGSTAHVRSRFDPDDLMATVRTEGASVLFGVPASYQALLDTAAGAPLLQGLRLAVCGSAPLSPALAARLPGLLGQLPLIRYGTTESGLDVSNPLGAARLDTVGLPLPGVQCRIWAAGQEAAGGREAPGGQETPGRQEAPGGQETPGGQEAPPGTDGEIQLRGPHVFQGYWHDPAATAAAFTPDGWFRTGDIGAVDPASGHLVIRGRSKELIISGGLNVYPREVEIALERHPSVAEAAVAALPHPRWGEQVTAWIVPRPGAVVSEAELAAHARTLLAAYKCPKQVFTLTALPRNPLGKLNRAALSRPPVPRPPTEPRGPRPSPGSAALSATYPAERAP
ncbi:MAG TPA: AMP-binding protein [Streptosporangiaceae bacterium]